MLTESASRRWMLALLLFMTLLTAIFAATVWLRPPGAYLPWVDGGIYVLIHLLTVGVLALRALRGGPRARAWGILSTAYLCYALGEVWWALVGRFDEEPSPLPVEDALWLIYYPLVFWSIGHLTSQGQGRRRHRTYLDALVLGGGAFVLLALLTQAWLIDRAQAEPDSSVMLIGIYVGLDLALVVLSLLLAFVQDFRITRGWWLLLAGLLTFGTADTLFWIQLSQEAYVEGGWLDLGWPLASLAIAGAALAGLPPLSPTQSRTLRGILPASLAVVTAAIALHWSGEGLFGQFARLGATATLFLALVRLTYAIRDATLAEAAAQASKDRFERLLRIAPVPLGFTDAQDRIRLVNDAYERLFGFTREEVPLLPDWYRRVYPDPVYRRQVRATWKESIRQALAGQGPVGPQECRVTRGDGAIRHVEISAVELDGGMLTAFIDVTARKAAEERLVQAQRLAEEASRAKSEFLAHMSHEIRTPMYSVLGLAQMVGREPLSANQRGMIDRIQAAGQSLLGIIDDILDLSRIEAGKLAIDVHPLDLADLLTKLEGLFAPKARAEGLALHIPGPPPALGLLQGDPLRLEQVLTNLIGNAIKFTDSGLVAVELQVLAQSAREVRLRFAVRDTGIGIAPEVLKVLFTPFTQGDSRIIRPYGGTGLGLAISKRLVELMGGRIGAESQPGKGSTFWFELSLPRTSGAEPVVPTWGKTTPGAGPALGGWRFLVVDDSDTHRELMAQALTLEGATVTTAVNGQQAVRLLESTPASYDVVLLDLQMPVMDGLTATRLIRGPLGLPSLPIIALTAGVLPEQRQAAEEAGVDAVLTKPLDLDRIAILLHRWLPARATHPEPTATASGVGAEPAADPDPAVPAPEPFPAVEAAPGPGLMALPAAEPGSVPGPTAALAGDSGPSGSDFPSIPGINPVKAARLFRGNRALFRKLLAGLGPKFGGVAAATRVDLTQGERDGAARRMHQLRGYAANLCAQGLMRQAGLLEEAILRGEMDLEERLGDLALQIADLIAASESWLSLDPDPKGTVPEDQIQARLRKGCGKVI